MAGGGAVLAWVVALVQQRGVVISEQVVSNFVLTLLVIRRFAFKIRLPSVAATSHRAEYSVREPQLFKPSGMCWCGNCTIHWLGLLRVLFGTIGRVVSLSCSE